MVSPVVVDPRHTVDLSKRMQLHALRREVAPLEQVLIELQEDMDTSWEPLLSALQTALMLDLVTPAMRERWGAFARELDAHQRTWAPEFEALSAILRPHLPERMSGFEEKQERYMRGLRQAHALLAQASAQETDGWTMDDLWAALKPRVPMPSALGYAYLLQAAVRLALVRWRDASEPVWLEKMPEAERARLIEAPTEAFLRDLGALFSFSPHDDPASFEGVEVNQADFVGWMETGETTEALRLQLGL